VEFHYSPSGDVLFYSAAIIPEEKRGTLSREGLNVEGGKKKG
jgi:hypothetical protein